MNEVKITFGFLATPRPRSEQIAAEIEAFWQKKHGWVIDAEG